jgi:hypothetical protein
MSLSELIVEDTALDCLKELGVAIGPRHPSRHTGAEDAEWEVPLTLKLY